MLVNEHEQEVSWARIVRDCQTLVDALKARGVSEKDRVVLSAENSADFVLTLFALIELGVSIGLVDRRTPQDAFADLVADSGARWLVSDHEQLDSSFDRVRVGWLPLAELTAAAQEAGAAAVEPTAGPEALTFERWAARDDALIVWSSGSTGVPKGIVRSGASVFANIGRTQERMGYRPDDVLLPLLPFTHQYGLSLLLLWWRCGSTMALVSSRRVDQALDVIGERGVTVVDAVPATYYTMLRILDGRAAAATKLDSVRMWCVGGEPLRDELRGRFAEQIGQPLLDGYGSSEAGNIALAVPGNSDHCGQPLPGVTVQVLGDDGRPVPTGQLGEVVVSTPDFMVGLLEPGGTVRRVRRPAYHTDDIGYLDENGNLRVLGRRAAVHRFGHTLYPDAIATRAGACGNPVRVVPVDDSRRGTQLVFVVADPQDRPVAHWRRALAQVVAEHEQPNRIVVLDEFPLNNNGKEDARALREVAEAAVAMEGVKGVLPVNRPANGFADTDLSRIPFPDRVARLEAVADLLRDRRTEVLSILTEVSNHKTAYGEIDASIAALEGAVAEVTRYQPDPVNQVGVLMPSNIPLYSYMLYLMIPTLYSRRVVFRPSRRIEDQTRKLHELFAPVHGLPIELDDRDQKAFMADAGAESDVLVFTGGYNNAEKIRPTLRREQLFLYFGQGVNPYVVGADADIPKAVEGLLRVRMLNSGQDCFGPDVAFVHTSVSAQFCNLLCRRVTALRYGALNDPAADYGAMFYLDAFDASLEYLRKNRERVAAGGEVSFVDDHLSPTVLIQPADTALNPPELFAPIFNVVPFSTTEWLHKMLRHPYFDERAMAASVFGTMPETVELLESRHTVSVNETLIEIENGNEPFGGKGIRANYAAIGKKRYAEPLLISKAVADHLGGAANVAAERIA